MDKKELQIKMFVYIMMKAVEEIAKVDEEMQEDMEEYVVKIQWRIGENVKGYQVFNEGEYSYALDAEIDDPDVTMTINDIDKAKAFFMGEIDGTSAYMSGDLTIEGSLPLILEYNNIADHIMDYLEPIRG